jgi:hypothetical protein
MNEIYALAKLSAIRAFLGSIDYSVRAISITTSDKEISVMAYYNREPSEEDIELMDNVETEILADMPEECKVSIRCTYLEPETKIPYISSQSFIFLRKGEKIDQQYFN